MTADPSVVIEDRGDGWVVYRRDTDGRRWRVDGTCDRRGDCLIGAVVRGVTIRDHAHIDELRRRWGVDRIDSELDVPVTPGFDTCCGSDGTLTVVEL